MRFRGYGIDGRVRCRKMTGRQSFASGKGFRGRTGLPRCRVKAARTQVIFVFGLH